MTLQEAVTAALVAAGYHDPQPVITYHGLHHHHVTLNGEYIGVWNTLNDCFIGSTMMVKATKTSLYKLVAEYAKLPPMIRTQYVKTPRVQSYFLKWGADDGICYSAYFSICMGRPLLWISGEKYDEETGDSRVVIRKAHYPTIQDLLCRGMLKVQLAKVP